MIASRTILIIGCLAACDLGPRVTDLPDADGAPDAYRYILPPGTAVPSIASNPELVLQIRINDGLLDTAVVVTRGIGKAGGAVVRFWNFGPAPIESGIAVAAPVYVFGTVDDAVFTPLPDHPRLIDAIPGDIRYSPIRRVVNVAVTERYQGELITSVAALGEAIELGLVEDPVPDGTWVNLPVVLPGTTLEVADAPAPAMAATQVFGRGYRVDVFELGTSLGRQPLRAGFIPIGQAAGLLSGVATGMPPTKPTTPDPQPVFQFVIPTMPPGNVFSYSPLATDVAVRLANTVAPSSIASDTQLFTRNAAGAITGYHVDTVESFTITATVNNLQLQFADGAP